MWQPADIRKNKTTQLWRVTGFAARRPTMKPLEFSKTGKKRRLKRQIFCFCGVTVVSSTVFHCLKEKSLVNMWMLTWECCDFFPWRNLALFPGGVNQFLIGTFTPVSSLCMIVYYIGRWTAQVTSMRGTCGVTTQVSDNMVTNCFPLISCSPDVNSLHSLMQTLCLSQYFLVWLYPLEK